MIYLVDLFCGAGGFSEGFLMGAEARLLLAVDSWTAALDVHSRHHEGPHLNMTIALDSLEVLINRILGEMESVAFGQGD